MEILVVDDSESDAMIIEEAIEELGWDAHIHNVWDGDQAIEYLHHEPDAQHHRPDLVILDLNMPRKNGFEVLDDIKHDHGLANIPVLVLTTSHAEGDIMKAFEHGAESYLTKPSGYADIPKVAQEMQVFCFHYGLVPS